jgi:2-polyprenyl-6-methoxyphenol hydroxylase-like FAD-dependent oxidoreductase
MTLVQQKSPENHLHPADSKEHWMLPKEAEVVVVGGGPTGLVLTSTLCQAGHDVLALDRQAEGANDSRAAAIHAKTLEVLRELNVTDRLVAEGS